MCSCLPSLKLPCLKISDLEITGWPQHQRGFGYVPGIELLAGSSFFPAKVKCSQKKEKIDYLVWKQDWHASSSPVDLILPSRDCAASRELSQGRRGPRGVGRLPLRNSSSKKILPRHWGKEQTVGSKPRS